MHTGQCVADDSPMTTATEPSTFESATRPGQNSVEPLAGPTTATPTSTFVLDSDAMARLTSSFLASAHRLEGIAVLLDGNTTRAHLSTHLPASSLHDAIRDTCSAWSEECTRDAALIKALGTATQEIATLATAGDTESANDLSAISSRRR